MADDRTGGGRRKGGVKPPVVHFSGDFSPASEPPEPFDVSELRKHAAARGFVDGDTNQAEYMLNRISYQHASSYFDLFKDGGGSIGGSASLKLVSKRSSAGAWEASPCKEEAPVMRHRGEPFPKL